MINIYIDGGAFPNPGQKVICIIIKDDDRVIRKTVSKTGYGTNNEAEYESFIKALKEAQELGLKKFTLCSDSMLVLNQMAGNWKIKNPKFLTYLEEFNKLKDNFDEVDFLYIRRDMNPAHKFIESQYGSTMKIFSLKK